MGYLRPCAWSIDGTLIYDPSSSVRPGAMAPAELVASWCSPGDDAVLTNKSAGNGIIDVYEWTNSLAGDARRQWRAEYDATA
jgi:hypothetical protein